MPTVGFDKGRFLWIVPRSLPALSSVRSKCMFIIPHLYHIWYLTISQKLVIVVSVAFWLQGVSPYGSMFLIKVCLRKRLANEYKFHRFWKKCLYSAFLGFKKKLKQIKSTFEWKMSVWIALHPTMKDYVKIPSPFVAGWEGEVYVHSSFYSCVFVSICPVPNPT